MAALTSSAVTPTGLLAAPAAVASSDTIALNQFGATGVNLRVINGGASPDSVAVSDPNLTAQGNAGTVVPVVVTNATTKTIFIPVSAVNATTGVATVTHSFITTVTYELTRV